MYKRPSEITKGKILEIELVSLKKKKKKNSGPPSDLLFLTFFSVVFKHMNKNVVNKSWKIFKNLIQLNVIK